MKHFIKPLVVLSISAVLLGLAVYLHSIDHPIKLPPILGPIVPPGEKVKIVFLTPPPPPIQIPPPWYASLWPIPLVVGIAGLAYSTYSTIRLLKK